MARSKHLSFPHAGVTNKWKRTGHRIFDSTGKCIYEGKVGHFSLSKRAISQPRMPSINAAKHYMRTGKSK